MQKQPISCALIALFCWALFGLVKKKTYHLPKVPKKPSRPLRLVAISLSINHLIS